MLLSANHTMMARPCMSAALRSGRQAACLAHPQARRPQVHCMASAADSAFDGYSASLAFLFPGQGAQSVGMGREVMEVHEAKKLFDKASEILGYDLLQVCLEGPKEKLDSTAVSQPAIYVSSLAVVEKLKTTPEGAQAVAAADVAAGLSLGEYTALVFAGAVSFEDGLRLVKLRGEAMQAAADASRSGMVSVIGLDSDKVAELCVAATKEAGADKAVKVANYLCPGNYVVSGAIEGCEAVEKLAKSFKARMCVRLAVAGAFHTEYMQPAVSKLEAALKATPISKPRIPVVSNVDSAPHADPDTIRAILAKQVTSPVQWESTMKILLNEKGIKKSYELGPGKVISGIVKRISKEADIVTINP